jgi:two-component system NarL family response regulator
MTDFQSQAPSAPASEREPAELRVLLVEDDVLLGTLLQELLSRQPDVRLVGTATSAEEALAVAGAEHPDLVLLDIGLPDRSGLELLVDLVEASPTARVLMLTLADDMESVLTAFRCGAIGYIPKRLAMQSLVPAIQAARNGLPWIDPAMTLAVLAELRRISEELESLQRPDSQLTEREREVAHLVAFGAPDQEIATRLELSPHTVRVHIKRIRHKLGLSNRAALAAYINKGK